MLQLGIFWAQNEACAGPSPPARERRQGEMPHHFQKGSHVKLERETSMSCPAGVMPCTKPGDETFVSPADTQVHIVEK